MKTWKRKSTPLLVLLAVLLVLAGCGNNGAENGSDAGTDSGDGGSQGKGVTLTIEAGQAMMNNNPYVFNEENIKKFEEETGIKVDVILTPDNQVKNVLQTKLTTGETPDLIVFNKVSAENELRTMDNMLDLSNEPWVERLTDPDSLRAPDGNIYGFVMHRPLDAQIVVYNKKIFDDLNLTPPTSYDEFLEVCEALLEAGITPIYAPFKDAWTAQIWPAASFGYIAQEVKPGLWDQINAGEVKFSEVPEFEEVLNKYYALYEKGYITNTALSDEYNMAPNVFSNGQAAMMIMGDWFITDMASKDPDLELDFFPIPAFNDTELMISQGQLGGMIHIPKAAKHPEEAKQFIDFMSQPEQIARAQSDLPFLPSVKDADMPELNPMQQRIYDEYVQTNKTVVEMNAYMKVDLTELWKYYQDMFAGVKTPKEVLEAWDQKFAELMTAAGYPGFE
jgi:raffinose/stachyose/melibiose transport system substrate-binding protein